MNLDDQCQSELRQRIEQSIAFEVESNVAALYEFIDPHIRASRKRRYPFEPELTISQIGEFVPLER